MAVFYFEQLGGRIEVRIASDAPVNAWQGSVLLPFDVRNVQVSTASSISDVWQEAPTFRPGKISFTGGKLNGFVGDGVLFEFTVGPGSYPLRFSPETSVYLNDGLGTKSQAELRILNFSLSSDLSTPITEDATPPEPFTPTIYREKGFFDGNPVAIFSTRDLQSGISRYEVREILEDGVIDWHIGQSPYLINSDVRMLEIKAIDYFGNERVETLKIGNFLVWEVAAILFVILLAAMWYTLKGWRDGKIAYK